MKFISRWRTAQVLNMAILLASVLGTLAGVELGGHVGNVALSILSFGRDSTVELETCVFGSCVGIGAVAGAELAAYSMLNDSTFKVLTNGVNFPQCHGSRFDN